MELKSPPVTNGLYDEDAAWRRALVYAGVFDESPAAGVRCPKCDKKLGESLQGTYVTTCPRCKERVTITR